MASTVAWFLTTCEILREFRTVKSKRVCKRLSVKMYRPPVFSVSLKTHRVSAWVTNAKISSLSENPKEETKKVIRGLFGFPAVEIIMAYRKFTIRHCLKKMLLLGLLAFLQGFLRMPYPQNVSGECRREEICAGYLPFMLSISACAWGSPSSLAFFRFSIASAFFPCSP